MTLGNDLLELDVPEHRPGFFEELRDGLRPRRNRRPLFVAAVAAAIVAGVLAFTLTRGSGVAAAAQVEAAVEHALASTGSISGIMVRTEGGRTTPGAAPFVLSSTGAFRLVDSTGNGLVYDPTRNTETYFIDSDYLRITGFAEGPPDGASDSILQPGLGTLVATLAHATGAKVENVIYNGRPAWFVRGPSGTPGEQSTITVDRATGMPVRVQTLRGGVVVSEWRIEHLQMSSTVPRITPPAPKHGQKVETSDLGFRSTSLAGARVAAGYEPLVPKRLPHGFSLAGVAFASSPRARRGADVGNSNPASRDVISLLYRRGFDEIVVSTRRTGAEPSAWKDPFQSLPVPGAAPRLITFTGGALAGQKGSLVLLSAFPHVWTAGPKLVVTVAGTVDRAELLQVANSLTAR
ncbi:MAG TPA: hypothetical protein VGH79_02835 [Gaiellaceae bacterium]|jgi:hypothetical protein